MTTWFSIHLQALETPDVFLARGLYPFLEQHVWPVSGARAFFVRYADASGPHLRLRFRGEADWLATTLRPALETFLAERGTWIEQPYLPETERFGGPEALPWCEEHFHVSTRVVLDRLRRPTHTYGDSLFDALRLHTVAAFAAGFNRSEAADYFQRLARAWVPVYFEPAEPGQTAEQVAEEVLADFEETLAPQRANLRAGLDEVWTALESQKHDTTQPEWLRWLRGNQLILKELGGAVERVFPSLLHLTNNRLGINNHDETYLMYVLGEQAGQGGVG